MDSSNNNPLPVPDVGQRRLLNSNQEFQLTEYSDDIGVAVGEDNRPPTPPFNTPQLPVRPAVVPRGNLFRSLFMITFAIVQLDHPEAPYPEIWQHIVNKLLNTPLFATEADVIRAWNSAF